MASSKAAFHVPEGEDETLHAAAYAGNKARICMFFNSGGGTASSKDEDGRTPLHWACAGGHAELVQYMFDSFPSEAKMVKTINRQDDGGWSPLMSSVSAGHVTVVQMLLEKGADTSLRNDAGQIALHYVKKSEEMTRMLLEKTKDINVKATNAKSTPLLKSIIGGNIRVVKLLVAAGGSVNERDRGGNTALHLAYDEGDEEIVQFLLDNNASKILKNGDGKTPEEMRR